LPVLTYRTVPEAIERANATNYGLGASVWSSDPLRAAEVAEKLESGTVWVNTHMQLTRALSDHFQRLTSADAGRPWVRVVVTVRLLMPYYMM
jgi:acyl-CoA reductase-like NAD-dependent aldehyde dehydrogenase